MFYEKEWTVILIEQNCKNILKSIVLIFIKNKTK